MLDLNNSYKILRNKLHYIYLIFALPLVLTVGILTPPYQNADEPNHFKRAEQFSRLEIVPVFVKQPPIAGDTLTTNAIVLYPSPGGFTADKGIDESYSYLLPVSFHPNVKVNKDKLNSAKTIRWGTGINHSNFANTAIYSPIGYIMQTIGIIIGKGIGMTVISTLHLSRILNSLAAICICYFAIFLAKRSKELLFIVLLLPMSVSLFASVSQDAMIISASFLLVALIDLIEFNDKRKYLPGHIALMTILMVVIALIKPPYIILAFVFFFLTIRPIQKIMLAGIPFLLTVSWLFLDHNNLSVVFAPGWMHVNTKLQAAHILQHPFKFASLFFKIDVTGIIGNAKMFVGILGWLDFSLPNVYYVVAFIIIIIGFIVNAKVKQQDYRWVRAALLFSAFITLLALLTVQYVTWTALDAPRLGGMAGRYLIPIFPFVALGLARVSSSENPKNPLWHLVPMVFPVITAIFLITGLIFRYYK